MTYQLEDDGQAAWAMRRRARLEAERLRITDLWTEQIDRLGAELRTRTAGLQRDIDFFDGLLIDYHAERIGATELVPTVAEWLSVIKQHRLPYGRISARRISEEIAVDDDAAFARWVIAEHPELVNQLLGFRARGTDVRATIAQRDGQWYWTGTGETTDPPPGLYVRPARISITVSSDDAELPSYDPAPDGCDIPDGTMESDR